MYNYKTGIIYRQIDRQKYTQRGRERENMQFTRKIQKVGAETIALFSP